MSRATNLVNGYTGSGAQVYLWDEATGAISLVSSSTGNPVVGGNGNCVLPFLGGNGQDIYYLSYATDLIPNFSDGNGTNSQDIFLYDAVSGQTSLVTHQAGSCSVSGNGAALFPWSVSDDGRYVVFGELSTDLVPSFVGLNTNTTFGDAFSYDRLTGSVFLADGHIGSDSLGPNKPADAAELSADGTTIVFTTAASDIIAGLQDSNGADDVFMRDVATGSITLASRRFGVPSLSAGGDSNWVRQSADGRYVVYTSVATNIVPGQVDTEGSQDVFLFDRYTNTSTLVSHAFDSPVTSASGDPNGFSGANAVISADGRYVAYVSMATNLVQGFVDSNGLGYNYDGNELGSGADIFLYDRVTEINTLVSHQAGNPVVGGDQTSGTFGAYEDYLISLSADGRYVAYFSLATDLVAGFVDHNGTTPSADTGSDVFVYDRVTGNNTLVSHIPNLPLDGGNDSSYEPTISGDGRYVAFWSYSYNLVAGMVANQQRKVYVFDQQTGIVSLVSHVASAQNAAPNGDSNRPILSEDGNYIVYQSAANNIVTGGADPNNANDVFLYNVQTKTNVLVSHAYNSTVNAGSLISDLDFGTVTQTISDDGRYVVFQSNAENLINGFVDGNGSDELGDGSNDIYLYDRVTGTNTLVSHMAGSLVAGGNNTTSFAPEISGDGRFVAFASSASNLISGFTSSVANNVVFYNVYVYDRLSGTNTLVTHAIGSPLVGCDEEGLSPSLSTDGSVVSYLCGATNVVPGDFNSHQDVIAYVTPPARVQSLQIADGSAQRSIIRSLTVTFDQAVTFAGDPAAAFEVTRVGSGDVSLNVNMSADGTTATVTFSGALTQFGSLIDGNYQLTIHADQVTGYIGNLDGDDDGVAGGDYSATFFRLFGDANGDRHVDAADFLAFRLSLLQPSTVFDYDGSGSVDAADFLQFRLRFLQMI